LATLSWLAEEESLASVQLKRRLGGQLQFENDSDLDSVKYGNIALVILLPFFVGAGFMLRRRNLRQYTYESRR